jgi:hypothetical protein
VEKDKAKEIAIYVGKHKEFCKCEETIRILGRACDFCRDEQIRDFNYCEHLLDGAFPFDS